MGPLKSDDAHALQCVFAYVTSLYLVMFIVSSQKSKKEVKILVNYLRAFNMNVPCLWQVINMATRCNTDNMKWHKLGVMYR